jgi:hypothetical protein
MKSSRNVTVMAALAACLILAGVSLVIAQPPADGAGRQGRRGLDPAQMFDGLDTNKDGSVTKAEFEAGMAAFRNRRPGGQNANEGAANAAGDPAQRFRQGMIDRLKENMGATDKEWTVLQPLVEKVVELRRAQGMGGFRGGDNAEEPAATSDLRKALANKEASSEELQKKMEAFRAEKKKQAADLEAARTKLREVLTARQEAALVLDGILD